MAHLPFEFDGVVRLTRIGAGYLIFTIIVGFAALNTGNNSLYIGLAFMLGALVLSGIASKGGLKRLRVQLAAIEEIWAGVPAQATLRIENRSRWWSIADVALTSDDFALPLFVSSIGRRESVEVDAKLLFQRRGRVSFRNIAAYTRYPFGFFTKKRVLKFSGETIVFPRLLEDRSRVDLYSDSLGESYQSIRSGSGTDVFAYREYVRGDSLRHLHWKKSASIGRWIMKQPGAETADAVTVIVDHYLPPGVEEEQFEELISAAATYLDEAIARDYEVTLHFATVTLSGKGRNIRRAVFEGLALLDASRTPSTLVAPRGAIVFSLRGRDVAKIA